MVKMKDRGRNEKQHKPSSAVKLKNTSSAVKLKKTRHQL